jgi:hypothetical protein
VYSQADQCRQLAVLLRRGHRLVVVPCRVHQHRGQLPGFEQHGDALLTAHGDAQNAQAQAGLVAHHRSDLGGIDRRVAEQREYPWHPLCTAAEYAQRRGGLEYLGSRTVLIRVRARGHGVAPFRVGQATGA